MSTCKISLSTTVSSRAWDEYRKDTELYTVDEKLKIQKNIDYPN